MRFTPVSYVTLEVRMKEFANINTLFAYWYLIQNDRQEKSRDFFGVRCALEKTVPPQGEASEETNPSQYDIEIQGSSMLEEEWMVDW